MRDKTYEIAADLGDFLVEDYIGRLGVLKDTFVGDTAYVVSCGPSIADVWSDDLYAFLNDKFCMAVKQALGLLKGSCDMYLLNPIHIYEDQIDPTCIIVGACDTVTLKRHKNTEKFWDMVPDIYGDIKRTQLVDSLVSRCNFDDADIGASGVVERPWGPGLLLDIGLFLLKWMGFTRIIVFGWDMFSGNIYEHYYDGNTIVDRENLMSERDMMIKMAPYLVEWFARSGVELRLCSPRSVLPIPQVHIGDVIGGKYEPQ